MLLSFPSWSHEAAFHNHNGSIVKYYTCSTGGQYDTGSEAWQACQQSSLGGLCYSYPGPASGGGCSLSGAPNGVWGTSEIADGGMEGNWTIKNISHTIYLGGLPECISGLQTDANGEALCSPPQEPENQGGQCPITNAPVSFGSGNKFQLETDYQGTGTMALRIQRAYNGLDGIWRFAYSRHLELLDATAIYAWTDLGKGNLFTQNGTDWESLSHTPDTLIATANGFELQLPDDTVESYNSEGRLVAIENRQGQTVTFAYDVDNRLETVTHFSGRTLTYTYDNDDRITSIADPSRKRLWLWVRC